MKDRREAKKQQEEVEKQESGSDEDEDMVADDSDVDMASEAGSDVSDDQMQQDIADTSDEEEIEEDVDFGKMDFKQKKSNLPFAATVNAPGTKKKRLEEEIRKAEKSAAREARDSEDETEVAMDKAIKYVFCFFVVYCIENDLIGLVVLDDWSLFRCILGEPVAKPRRMISRSLRRRKRECRSKKLSLPSNGKNATKTPKTPWPNARYIFRFVLFIFCMVLT